MKKFSPDYGTTKALIATELKATELFAVFEDEYVGAGGLGVDGGRDKG